ncbi:glutathione S-transferase omega-1-like [Eleutherodactylus coqui]|uniref:glutathione S-transferase omega-1-like n=1 Tax=Eleutherodactylus coqui TaxID=57060 RepID=UPI003462E38F
MSRSQRSLAKGSPAPGPVPEGVIRLYSMRLSPYVRRARLVLIFKGIKHEVVNINLKSKPEWLFEKSPLGLVPFLETHDGKIIYESPIICDYLDEAYPGNKLTPADPYAKAQQKMLLEHFKMVASIMIMILQAKNKNEDITELQSKLFEKFQIFEEELAKKNTLYFGGESISMLDYMIWPWFEWLHLFDFTDYLEKTPRIEAWTRLMLQDAAVKETFIEPDVYSGFILLYFQDSIDAADYGLD